MNVFFAVVMGAMALGQATPNITKFLTAKGSMGVVLEVIQRQSMINPLVDSGRKLDKVDGRIELKSVHFFYPNRKEVRVLNDFSLMVNPGETVALVGHSGCGKDIRKRFLSLS